MTVKLELFLAPGPAYRSGDDVAALAEAVDEALAAVGTLRAVGHDPGILGGLAHGDETASAPAFAGLLEITWADSVAVDDPEIASALAAVAAALGAATAFDPVRSTAVAGTEHVIVNGDEPLMLAMALRRRTEMTRATFSDYWLTHHAELGRQVPGSEGYRQLHRDDPLTEQARAALGLGGPEFDGVALAYYSSDDTFRSIMANAEIVERLLADERRFIDHSEAAMVVGRSPGATSRS